MKKTIPISIAQTLFYIEEDSYKKLEDYLSEVRKYFSTYEDSAEIIGDIESRIREQFLQFSQEDKTERIITGTHIDKLIKNMGWPKEFGEFNRDENSSGAGEKRAKTPKRLYRDKDNAIIGGVAAGIAAYFGIDPWIVRFIFLIFMFFGGSGILIYLILWLVVPAAETATEILEMQGDPVTLNQVRKIVEEKISEVKEKKNIKNDTKNFFEKLRSALLKIGVMFFKILGRVIGTVLKITSILGAIGMLIFLGVMLILPGTNSHAGILNQFRELPYYYILSFLVFLVGLMPLLFLNRLGNVFWGKPMFSKAKYTGISFAVWVTALIILPILFFSVRDLYLAKVRSNTQIIGTEVVSTREVKDFSRLTIKDGQHVTIVQGPKTNVAIRGTQDNIDRLVFTETPDTLNIQNSDDDWNICIFCKRPETIITITAPELSYLGVENGSEIKGNLEIKDLEVKIENGSEVILTGKTEKFIVTIENASSLDAKDFIANIADINVMNASSAEVNVKNEITGGVSNASNLTQYGEASIEKVWESNGSKVQKEAAVQSLLR